MSEGSGKAEVERRLVEDPKGTVEQELGRRLPEGVRVEAVEENPRHHLTGASKHLDGRP